ncbi:hypothetical protein IW146_008014 [Coemansia sp. RSA 922]|nr:hypothetical protein IW146_008014 [Coemansia sp. RSA 922]
MAHISDLPAPVLAQILYMAADTPPLTLSQWKIKLPLLAVCRAWAKLAIGAVFNQVYVELFNVCPHCGPPMVAFVCVSNLTLASNAELFISRGCMILARRLKIELADRATTDHLLYVVQNTLKLKDIDWMYINTLAITDQPWRCEHFDWFTDAEEIRCEDVASILQYFRRNMRNVIELDLTYVPRNFAWHHFRYDIFDLPIVFRELTILDLTFKHEDTPLTEDERQDKIASGTHNCDQLSFPALKQLSIRNCTPDCDLLYADIPFPKLKKVHLWGDFTSICHCSRLKFTWVRELYVSISLSHSRDSADFYKITNHFFSNIRIGQTATLSIYDRLILDPSVITSDWFILDPDVMHWVNLTKLEVANSDCDSL